MAAIGTLFYKNKFYVSAQLAKCILLHAY